MRLSKDDGNNQESESITNQRNLISKYAKELNINILKEYVDDGYSGTNFNRPGFKEMIKDIKNGKIDSIIVKDLSRFARESIEASYYIEKYFPEHNIRFIAILDNVDSFLDKMSNELLEFKLYNNQKFARDTSLRIKKSKRENMKKGLYIATYVAYGYKKDPSKKGKIIIDKKVSKIVKLIFKMYLEGKSSSYIAMYLTNKKIKTPSEHIGIIPYKETNMHSIWKTAQVLRILKNQIYVGNTVRNVENKVSYKSRDKRKTKKEEWIITENTHEPIILKEDFEKVQELIKSKNGKAQKLKYNYLLRPYLYCGYCGRKINFDTRRKRNVGLACPKVVYNCCEHYYYNYQKLETKILCSIKEYYMKLFNYQKAEESVLEQKQKNILEENKRLKKKLEYKYSKINDEVDFLYMAKIDNKITEEEYKMKMQIYNATREDLDKEILKCNEIALSFEDKKVNELKEIIKHEKEILEQNVSSELVDKLIYRIELFKDKVEVKYKFKFF